MIKDIDFTSGQLLVTLWSLCGQSVVRRSPLGGEHLDLCPFRMVQSVHLWWDLCLRSKSITPRETPLSVPGIKRGQLSDPKVDTFDHWPVRAGHWVDTGSVRMSSLYSLPINDRCKILPVQLDTNGLQQQRSVDVLLVGLVESHFQGCWSCPRCIKFLFLVFVVERQTHPMWWLRKGKSWLSNYSHCCISY